MVDRLGMFGSGGYYDELVDRHWVPVYYAGHKDFVNLSEYGFDYDLEDYRVSSTPYLHPGFHFQSMDDSATQVNNAVEKCDSPEFQSRMHRLQDFYTHYEKGYRWDPLGPGNIPGSGWGHFFDGSWPDRDNRAWVRAQAESLRWVTKWLDKCCVCAKGEWLKKEPGKCAKEQPELLYIGLPAGFNRDASSPPPKQP